MLPFRFQRQGAVPFSWLAMTALYQEQGREARGIAQGHENGESPFPIHPEHPQPLSETGLVGPNS